MKPIIEFEHVRKSYGEKTVLGDFSLAVAPGDFVTIVGASGGGKTTVLKMVNGLLTPDAGTIRVMGRDIRTMDLIQLRRNIGYAIQGSVLFPHMTVAENIAYVPNLLNKKDKARTKAAVAKWLAIVGLDEELLQRYPAELSGGQQQRVAEITRASLQQEIARIHCETGITVLFVTHDIAEALRLGTRVLVMANGEIQQYATPEEILRAPATDFVRQLVAGERHACHLPDDRLADCPYSGAAFTGKEDHT